MRTYPAPLRPYVEQVMRYHFEAEAAGRGGYSAGAGGKSITAASCERAAMLSLRAATCPVCQGTRVQTIDSPRRVIELECLRCCGEGEIARRVEPPPEAATTRCQRCNGSGRYRKRGSFLPDRRGHRSWVVNAGFLAPCRGWFKVRNGQRVWVPNPDYDPHHELAWCTRCRGSGWLPCGVLPMAGADHRVGYSPAEDDTTSAVGAALAVMRQSGQHDSVLALEVAYGELGNYVRQRLGEPVELALWPLTRPGKLLIERLRLPKGKRPHRALARVRQSTEPLMASMATVAHTAAVGALELALARHYAADELNGGATQSLSRRIQEAG